jgi:hypothetical protein
LKRELQPLLLLQMPKTLSGYLLVIGRRQQHYTSCVCSRVLILVASAKKFLLVIADVQFLCQLLLPSLHTGSSKHNHIGSIQPDTNIAKFTPLTINLPSFS